MDLHIDDHYPIGAAGGADFFSGAVQGDIVVEGPDGPELRREKVIVTGHDLEWAGIVCVGERTIRHFAHVLGMVDEWRVDRVTDDNRALRAELVELSTQLAAARAEGERLRDLERDAGPTVYVALDGSLHASARAALEAGRLGLGLESPLVAAAIPVRFTEPEDSPE